MIKILHKIFLCIGLFMCGFILNANLNDLISINKNIDGTWLIVWTLSICTIFITLSLLFIDLYYRRKEYE